MAQWMPIKRGDHLPPGAVLAGQTYSDGEVYVGRNSRGIGKLNLDKGKMYNIWVDGGGSTTEGEVLFITSGSKFEWIRVMRGDTIPSGALSGGQSSKHGPVYICRSKDGEAGNLSIQDGKVYKLHYHSHWTDKEEGHILCVHAVSHVQAQGMSSAPAPGALPNIAGQTGPAASQAQPASLENIAQRASQSAAPASAAPVPLRFPVPPSENVPTAPPTFPEMRGMSEAEMSYLRDNPVALEDWLHGLSQVQGAANRADKLREEHREVANQVLAKESRFSELQKTRDRSAEAFCQRQASVQALLAQRDQVLQQQSPQQLAAVLEDRAQASDTEAQKCLEQVHVAPSQLDARGLANFRTQYLQKMTEKHTRLALKERVTAGS